MDRRPQRVLFFAALAVFLLWVAALGLLAARSGRRPPPRLRSSAHPQSSRAPLLARSTTHGLVVDAAPEK